MKRVCKKAEEQLESISPTFTAQLLRTQIPKLQKDSLVISVFLHFWDLWVQKLQVKINS
jgi:hypothetical protein